MEHAFDVELWHEFYVMLGGACAALAGLLFIGMSLHVDRISQHPVLLARAWANSFLIIVLVINAAFVLVPQDIRVLGAELCLAPLVFMALLGRTMIRYLRSGIPVPWRPYVSQALALGMVLGGVSLLVQWGAGMYLVSLAYMALLIWIMFGTYQLMFARE
jgi:hypothetical protein